MIDNLRKLTRLLLVLLALFSGSAAACMVCIPFPESTATDRMLAGDTVVLARENPDKPFSYIAIEVLKGDLEQPAIDLFVNSQTRRRLRLNPSESVVLAYDSILKTWSIIGYATATYEAMVRKVLEYEPAWQRADGDTIRARFFIDYLANEEVALRELAYLEVGRASYNTIRLADPHVPAEQVYRFLADYQYFEWQPLYILLLGVEATPEEAKQVRDSMADHAGLKRTMHLSAWATALIEVDGTDAIQWLEVHYLGNSQRSETEVVEVVKALSVQGSASLSVLRRRIAESYALLVETHPSLAGWAARDLTSWNDWRLAETLDSLRTTTADMDSATAYAIDYYVGRAGSSGGSL